MYLKALGTDQKKLASSLFYDIATLLLLRLMKWSKIPYLCEGDLTQPIYHLTDYLMIFKPITDN